MAPHCAMNAIFGYEYVQSSAIITLRESIPRLFNGGRTTMTTRCAPACSQALPRGLGQRYWSVSEVTWPPKSGVSEVGVFGVLQPNDTVQHNKILHTSLLELRHNINQRLKPQKTPQSSPDRWAMGCLLWIICCDYSKKRKSNFKLKTATPYLSVTGELWGVYYQNFEENWPRYNGTALYCDFFCAGCLLFRQDPLLSSRLFVPDFLLCPTEHHPGDHHPTVYGPGIQSIWWPQVSWPEVWVWQPGNMLW